MRSIIKKFVPARVRRLLPELKMKAAVRKEFQEDRQRYSRYMGPGDALIRADAHPRHIEAQITKDYHRVEKGLSLREVKRPFGSLVERRLTMLLPVAEKSGAYSESGAAAMTALLDWNSSGAIAETVSPVASPAARGIDSAADFFETRHSVRDYSDEPVDVALLDEAVRLALQSPSVCNRQAWHVRFYEDTDSKLRALSHQNGNTGFRENIPVVALVTVDTRLFNGPGERHQGWIEGGIFASSLVWAFHALGLDSCMLNLSLANDKSDALRHALSVGDHELPIMMIAVGHGREGHRQAASRRRAIDEVKISPVAG